MYCHGLGLTKLGEFTDHEGFNGCMIGVENSHWHLEFTECDFHPIKPSPTQDDLLVLYFPDREQWESVCNNMEQAGFTRTGSFNPYWDKKGVTFEDHDGYRVVIQNMRWGSV